jgi:three-Cys-motif partner protein
MNQFGGGWTEQKIEMVVGYAKAYLTIMNRYPKFRTLYFDGFAGSGNIYKEEGNEIESIKGVALRILELNKPKPFDIYYFVEKSEKNKNELESLINTQFIDKTCHVVNDDCNNRLVTMANFLARRPDVRVLAFIDPFGMSVNWKSIESLKGLGIDVWILVPTGIGMNRLLKNDGNISEAWLDKLERFIGMSKKEIVEYFYHEKTVHTLFGEETHIAKEKQAIEKAGRLYQERLKLIFNYVSEPVPLKNSTGSVMYHFMMATNNRTALGIANDVSQKRRK